MPLSLHNGITGDCRQGEKEYYGQFIPSNQEVHVSTCRAEYRLKAVSLAKPRLDNTAAIPGYPALIALEIMFQ